MPRPLLSVITDPVPYGIYIPLELVKKALRKLKRIIKPIPHYMVSPYRGHPAVTRSLVEGLIKIGASANYNPKSYHQIGETVLVLSGVPALKQAIQLKRKGYIKKLLAGPNMVELPSDSNGWMASKEVDLCVINSEWTKKMYEDDCPSLKGRTIIWPAGVDTSYWKPDENKKRDKILIYEKQRKGPVGPVQPYKEWLELQGYKVDIVKCGEYTLHEFLIALQNAQLMIGFVVDESQGLAWAEAWAVDVPTLIWRNNRSLFRGSVIETSTAPYLTIDNGMFFDDFEDFKNVFMRWELMKKSFQPRRWVLEYMSDEICAKLLCKLADVRLCPL